MALDRATAFEKALEAKQSLAFKDLMTAHPILTETPDPFTDLLTRALAKTRLGVLRVVIADPRIEVFA